MKLSFRLLLLPAMISLLLACGEESNTLSNPTVNNPDAETTTICDDESFCIATQFLDEPVVGLNYRCNAVDSVTDEDGIFVCPHNSIVTFFLQSTNAVRKIELGKYRVRSLASSQNGEPLPLNLIVTPQDLLIQTDGTVVDNKQLTNMLRLLQSLDSDGSTPNRAINRIVIDSKDKFAIDALANDLTVSQFGVDNFDELLKPMFDKLAPKSIANITPEQANARFQDSLISVNTGVYEVIPSLIVDSDKVYNGMFGRWINPANSNLHSMIAMFFLVDRDGKTIGSALEWQKEFTANDLETKIIFDDLVLNTAPQHLFFASNDALFTSKGVVTDKFVLKNALGDKIKVTQGTLNKNNISPSQTNYRQLYGLTETQVVDTKLLGQWRRESATGIAQITSGTLGLQKTRTPNMYLDSKYWRTKDNVAVGEKPIFPLHVKMTLRDSNISSSCSNIGCLIGEYGITILENGNIITDRNNDCSIVDPVTLKDVSNVEEQRLGFVASVLVDRTQQTANNAVISPVMLVGDWANRLETSDPWYRIYGLHLGAIAGVSGGTKVQIDISRATSGVVDIANQQDEQDTFGPVALWGNYVKTFEYLKETDTTKKQLASSAMKGAVTAIQTQACYNPQPKT